MFTHTHTYREAFSIPKDQHKAMIEEIEQQIIDMAKDFSATVTVKGIILMC